MEGFINFQVVSVVSCAVLMPIILFLVFRLISK